MRDAGTQESEYFSWSNSNMNKEQKILREIKMKKYEFEHVRMTHGVEGELSKNFWEEKIENILADMGEKGWDLKAFHIHALHTHLIFGRERS